MAKLLMISGYGATNLHAKGAFYNTLEEFHKHWERVDIICPRGSARGQTTQYFGNVFVHESPWPIFLQPWFIARKGTELHQTHRFDLVTAHEYAPFYNGWGAYKLSKRIHVPYALEIMHIPGYPRAATLKESVYRFLTGLVVPYESRAAQGVRVINEHETPHFLKRSGVLPKKIFYAPAFYIDMSVFHADGAEKKYDCIFIGRLAVNKGIDLFLDAMKLGGFRALIVGDGPLKEHVRARVQVEGLSDRIIMHGWASDSTEVASLINQSRILVMTSYNEGGPRVVLEAMACGVPVMATRVGIVRDVVPTARQCDWIADDIARKATLLLGDCELYERARTDGLETAKRFEKTDAIRVYADELKKVVTG
ncbi:MAG: glycosyltransferase family 4 protein [Patescibacteria group bacterium]